MLTNQCKDKLPESHVFVNQWGRHYSKSHIHRLWADARGDIDLTLNQACRHSVASIAINDGVPEKAIQEFLGHKHIDTTKKYAHAGLKIQASMFTKEAEIIKMCPQGVPSTKNLKK